MENKTLIFKLPKDRESYAQKIIFLIVITCTVIYIIVNGWSGEFKDKFLFFLFGVIPIIVMYDKIYQFFSIDSIEVSEGELLTKKNSLMVNSSKINDLAIKVSIGIDGAIERSFYKFSTKNKLFSYKEKDMGKDESESLLKRIASLTSSNIDLFSESTYGQVVPISHDSISEKAIEAKTIYIIKKEGLKQWNWILVPLIVFLMIFTLILIK